MQMASENARPDGKSEINLPTEEQMTQQYAKWEDLIKNNPLLLKQVAYPNATSAGQKYTPGDQEKYK